MKILNDWKLLLLASLTLGLAPFVPEPHSLEKLRMLVRGELNRPVDIFDMIMHLLPLLLLILQVGRRIVLQNRRSG